jgi:hypothetical protein
LLPGLEVYALGADLNLVALKGAGGHERSWLRLGRSMRPLAPDGTVNFKGGGPDEALEYWAPDTGRWRPVEGVARQQEPSAWTAAAGLQQQERDYARSPGDAGIDLKALVKASRESGVLVSATSYIVVENSAQWKSLELGESRKLDQNAALGFLETPAPPALWVAAGFALWLGLRHWRRSRRSPAQPAAA